MSRSTLSLERLFTILLAGSALGAHGISCGNPCTEAGPPTTHVVPLGLPPADGPDGAAVSYDAGEDPCITLCFGATSCTKISSDGGAPALECNFSGSPPQCSGSGRRTAGYRPGKWEARDEVGAYLATATELERESIFAFRRLRRELRNHGAPASLLAWCTRAQRDEARHTRVLGALASRRGATIQDSRHATLASRPLANIALENAIEGCLHETFGALIARHQAVSAKEPGVSRAMKRIAVDETEHAALAFAIHAWLAPRLTEAERTWLGTEVKRAARELERNSDSRLGQRSRCLLGLPSLPESRRLARGLMKALV